MRLCLISGVHKLGPCQSSVIELLVKNVNRWKLRFSKVLTFENTFLIAYIRFAYIQKAFCKNFFGYLHSICVHSERVLQILFWLFTFDLSTFKKRSTGCLLRDSFLFFFFVHFLNIFFISLLIFFVFFNSLSIFFFYFVFFKKL